MAGTVRARMRGGMLELLEKVDLPEGKEVSVTIIDVPSSPDKEAFRRSAGSWKGTVDAETLIKISIRIDSSPHDLCHGYDRPLSP